MVIMKSNSSSNSFRNSSGCIDPTAYFAIRNIEKRTDDYQKFRNLLSAIFAVCHLAGFDIIGHITLRDRKTGRIWK